MRVFYDPAFLKKFKKVDVRIRKSVKERISIFSKNPSYPLLNNHALKRNFQGYNSIDITVNYRALFKEVKFETETVAYFVLLGTHEELYG